MPSKVSLQIKRYLFNDSSCLYFAISRFLKNLCPKKLIKDAWMSFYKHLSEKSLLCLHWRINKGKLGLSYYLVVSQDCLKRKLCKPIFSCWLVTRVRFASGFCDSARQNKTSIQLRYWVCREKKWLQALTPSGKASAAFSLLQVLGSTDWLSLA